MRDFTKENSQSGEESRESIEPIEVGKYYNAKNIRELLDKFIATVLDEGDFALKNYYFTPEMIVLTGNGKTKPKLKINITHMIAEFIFPPNALRRRFFMKYV